ncbi:paraquat-inducible protein A [Bisgaardia hudsonensis]|uniref:Paraquat-inducible protein A n=1 Tax=Bisgaardia hudsonensis TaxID=109472 RepID=A0A4R2N111_9PAST|nr:paraquat-inducible protein A [Bisgaardia hudsonensis]QLB13204.1 hypothetical protein A6A11_06045 [Bisgaardia hudsonensis]TCP13219.1 paraquat-inducible protein A [Bisgaardia hudsonensis]
MRKENNLINKKSHIDHCVDCDTVVSIPFLSEYQQAECPRCHNTVISGSRWGLRRCSIVALSILILLPFALNYPLLSIDLFGSKIDASVWQGIWKMATNGYPYTAFLILICSVIAPLFFVILILMLRISQLLKIQPRNVLITLGYIQPWVMFDVYFVALGVTIFKVREYASLYIDIYLIAFICTTILITLLFIKLNLKSLWYDFYPEHKVLNRNLITKPFLCTTCEYTFQNAYFDKKGNQCCPRCQTIIQQSFDIKLQRTWATLIAGIIMLIPANLLPISIVYVNGVATADTLMSGVLSFINTGSYFIAFIVFFASIFVPVSKILIMLYLLTCIHFKIKQNIKWQMKLLHIVHFVGRWSMLDLFVLALMMSLVSRGQIIDFSVGPAAFYFGIAVFLTMISTSQFDSRLLWKIYDRK